MSTPAPQLGRPVGARGEQTRQRIIAATMRCVAEVGYARATIREIARTAGITSANLYNYFPNKTELIRATIAARADIALPRLRRAATEPGTVADRIDAVLDESDRLMREYPDLAAFEWVIRAQAGVPLYPEPGERGAVEFQVLREVVEDIVDHPDPPGADAAKPGAVEVIYALLYGLAEVAATEPAATYRGALKAAKRLIRGTLLAAPPPDN